MSTRRKKSSHKLLKVTLGIVVLIVIFICVSDISELSPILAENKLVQNVYATKNHFFTAVSKRTPDIFSQGATEQKQPGYKQDDRAKLDQLIEKGME